MARHEHSDDHRRPPAGPQPRRAPRRAARLRLDRGVRRLARLLGAGRRPRVRRPAVRVPRHDVQPRGLGVLDRGRRHVRGRARRTAGAGARSGTPPPAARPDVGGRGRARRPRDRRARGRRPPLQRARRDRAERPERPGGAGHRAPVGVHRLVDRRPRRLLRGGRPAVRPGRPPRLRPSAPAARHRDPAAPRTVAGVGGLCRLRLGGRLCGRRARLPGPGRDAGVAGHVRGSRRHAAGEPARGRRHPPRRAGEPGARAAVGPPDPALARHRPRAGRLGLRGGARADRVHHQAAAPARGDRPRVPRLGPASTRAA